MPYHDIISLSNREASLLTALAGAGKEIFTTDDAYEVLGRERATRETLERLVEKGWLERIEKGKYLIVPLEAGPERTWTESALVIAAHLSEHTAVGYWSALRHWGLTEQVPRITYVQTTDRKSNRRPRILGMRFRIVRIKEDRFFGFEDLHVDQTAVRVTDREKTIIDCLDRPELCGGVSEVGKALYEGDGELDWCRMSDHLEGFGSGAVVKRLGFLTELLDLEHPPGGEHVDFWQQLLTAGISELDPSNARDSHRIITRWRVAVNLPEGGLVRRA